MLGQAQDFGGGVFKKRQIGTLYYERLLARPDRDAVQREAAENLAALL
jgi:hypothetical protein